MPRIFKQIELSHLSADPRDLRRLPVTTVLTKPHHPKSKSLQPCRCNHQGCGKMFSKRSNLKAHMRVHNGVLPYSCPFPGCIKRFRWKSSLKPHIRVHLASCHVLTATFSSSTAISSGACPDMGILSYTLNPQQRAVLFPESKFFGKVLDIQGTAHAFDRNNESGYHSSTNMNVLHAPRSGGETEQQQDILRRIEPITQHSSGIPPVIGSLFQDSQDQSDLANQEEIDLSADSVLSSSVTSYQTDVPSFSLEFPMEERQDSISYESLAEHLWKTDIYITDLFEDNSMACDDRSTELLSGLSELECSTGISTNSMEAHPSDSHWMISSGGTGDSTVSSADFNTTLHSLSM